MVHVHSAGGNGLVGDGLSCDEQVLKNVCSGDSTKPRLKLRLLAE